MMLENYLLLEPNVSCEYIIKINLMDNLLKNCHNPKINEILYSLVEPNLSKFNVFGELQVKIWEWCYENNFFYLLISLIQNERLDQILEEESGITEEILQNSKKYYSGEKNQIIMKEMVKKFGMFQGLMQDKVKKTESQEDIVASNIKENDSLDSVFGPSSLKNVELEYLKLEEIKGKIPDIDYLKGFVESLAQKKIQTISKTIKNPKEKEKEKMVNSVTILKIPNNDILNISSDSKKSTKRINVTQIQNKNNISEESLNKSTLDMQMGFTISKVKTIYPNRICKELITPLDKVAQKEEYKLQNILEEEKIAFPAASLIYNILNTVIENEENVNTRDFLQKKKCIGGLSVIDMFFNNSAVCIEKLFLVEFLSFF